MRLPLQGNGFTLLGKQSLQATLLPALLMKPRSNTVHIVASNGLFCRLKQPLLQPETAPSVTPCQPGRCAFRLIFQINFTNLEAKSTFVLKPSWHKTS